MRAEILTKYKFNKIINSQSDFDSLAIEQNDRIKLNGTFYGTKTINQSGVTIKGGCLKGSQELTGFTNEGAGIYSKVMSEPLWLYIDGCSAKLAGHSLGIEITSVPAINQIAVSAMDISGVDVVGSKCYYVPNPFSLSTEFTVSSESSGVLTLNKAHNTEIYSPDTGDNLFFYNRQSYITDNFDWAYESGTLYIKLPSDPSNYTINSVNINYGLTVEANNVSIKEVEIKHFLKAGIYSESEVDYVTSLSNHIHDIREDGIRLIGNHNWNKLVDNRIYNCGTGGIRQPSGSSSIIKLNKVYHIGVQKNIGWLSSYVNGSRNIIGFGILWSAHNESYVSKISMDNDIEKNVIYNCAYNGITSHKGYDTLITKNIVHHVCQVFKDGAGIYTFFFRNSHPKSASGVQLKHNFVSVDGSGENYGIYMDNRSTDNTLYKNTVINNSGNGGIMINADTKAHDLDSNTVYSKNQRALWYRDWAAPSKLYDNDQNVVDNNILISSKSTVYPMQFSDAVNPYTNAGSGNNNVYVSPYGTTVLNDGSNKTLSQLQSSYSTDAGSTELTNYITSPGDPDNEILIVENPSDNDLTGSAPSGSWCNVAGELVTNYTVSPWSSLVLLKDFV